MSVMVSSACVQGNDDVYMCVKDGDRISVSAAFVSGRTHPEDQSQVRQFFVSCVITSCLVIKEVFFLT